ncbi:paraquat-inducible protein A [Methylomagnum sp.]
MNSPALPRSAASLGLLSCHVCGLLSRPPGSSHAACCPRCGSRLHLRKPHSLSRTWALLIAAYILFIPANLLPIMQTGSLFGSQRDTIMSGVVYLWHSGSWPLALLVFFASIVVPAVKLIALTYLAVSVGRRSTQHQTGRAKLYRLLEFIGRWSMLDVYVVTLLSALVQLQSLATIKPEPGAVAFGAVVVLTMLAAMAFDPRLIWDMVEEEPPLIPPHPTPPSTPRRASLPQGEEAERRHAFTSDIPHA